MTNFHDSAFHVGVPAHLKLYALIALHVLKMFIEKFLALIPAYPYRSQRTNFGLSSNMERKASVTAGPLFVFTGIRKRNFENTSMTERMYL